MFLKNRQELDPNRPDKPILTPQQQKDVDEAKEMLPEQLDSLQYSTDPQSFPPLTEDMPPLTEDMPPLTEDMPPLTEDTILNALPISQLILNIENTPGNRPTEATPMVKRDIEL
jgi:hypothetical protein